MTEVYVDVGVASIESGGAAPDSLALPGDPEAIRAMRHLAEAGVQVFLISPNGEEPAPILRAAARDVLRTVPERPNAPAFYLTNDIERCQGSSARLRTVFVGGAPPGGSIRRCDAVARDLQAAAMEILAADAMPPRVG